MPPKRAASKAKSTTAAAVKVKDTNIEDKPQTTRPKRGRAADDDEADEAPANTKRRKPEAKAAVEAKPTSKAAKPTSKTVTKTAANGAAKPAGKPAPLAKAPSKSKVVAESVPPLNPLPTFPPVSRPASLVWVWGASDSGQLGLGPNQFNELSKPTRQPWAQQQLAEGTFGTEPGAGIICVAAGGLHTYLLDETGKVWSSGTNDEGALGRITKKEQAADDPTPKAQVYAPIETLVEEGFKVCQIATGDNYGAALNDQGDLKVWGTFRDDEGKSSFSSGVGKQMLPTSISILGQTTSKADKISSIAGGENHLVALTTKGEVYSWGIGGSGQLGRRVLSRHKSDALLPQRVVLGGRMRKAVLIGSGLRASFAVDQKGDVWAWGLNSVGQLGIGERGEVVSQPTLIEELSPENLPKGADNTPDRVVQIDGGEFHTIFRTAHGKVYACGACNDFQLGLPEDHEAFDGKGTRSAECVEVPTLVPMPSAVEEDDKVVSVCAGPRYNMAVTEHGVLLSWGVGVQSELGLAGGADSATTPQVVVRREGGWAVQQVSCGGQHVIGLFKSRKDS